VSLVARHLEENGMPTVVFSNARDISVRAFTPRTYFTNYPLGNPIGRPGNVEDQREGLLAGLRLLESATEPGTIMDSDRVWTESREWMRLIFSEEQPFLSDQAEARRLAETGQAD
jgi:D-proline reductase (dithiol) PrdB